MPLDTGRCVAAVADPTAGGIGCFIGVVRDSDHGRPVVSLDYEAHPTAEARLHEVCAEVAKGDVVAIAAEHRTGSLAVGDVAVVVAVSAVHRDDALRAAHKLIDAIKSSVPIWKHQVFTDGTDEWVGCC